MAESRRKPAARKAAPAPQKGAKAAPPKKDAVAGEAKPAAPQKETSQKEAPQKEAPQKEAKAAAESAEAPQTTAAPAQDPKDRKIADRVEAAPVMADSMADAKPSPKAAPRPARAARRVAPLRRLLGPANSLTVARIMLTLCVLLLWLSGFDLLRAVALVLYIIAGVTDLLDGLVARRYDKPSAFGAFLDPVADKLLLVVGSVAVLGIWDTWWVQLPIALILMREMAVVAMREWAARSGKEDAIAVVMSGKVKTVLQLVALGVLMGTVWPEVWARQLIVIGGALCLWAATFATVASFAVYLQSFLRVLREQEAKKA